MFIWFGAMAVKEKSNSKIKKHAEMKKKQDITTTSFLPKLQTSSVKEIEHCYTDRKGCSWTKNPAHLDIGKKGKNHKNYNKATVENKN